MSAETRLRIPLPTGETVDALLQRPAEGPSSWGAILAHGSRGDMGAKDLRAASQGLLSRGATTLRFRFLFRQTGAAEPDPQPRLLEAYRAALSWFKAETGFSGGRIVLGGRSLGARVASLAAAAGEPVAGLLLLAYPLHAPGQPEQRRDRQLYVVNRPMLFVSGDRDELAEGAQLDEVVRRLGAAARLVRLPGADHGFRIGRRGVSAKSLARIEEACAAWAALHVQGGRP